MDFKQLALNTIDQLTSRFLGDIGPLRDNARSRNYRQFLTMENISSLQKDFRITSSSAEQSCSLVV